MVPPEGQDRRSGGVLEEVGWDRVWTVGEDKNEWDRAFAETIEASVRQDRKKAWDHAFDEAEERAEQPAEAPEVLATLRSKLEHLDAGQPLPQPAPSSAEDDVFAKLRSQLGQLE